jgi:hypothetical protein
MERTWEGDIASIKTTQFQVSNFQAALGEI